MFFALRIEVGNAEMSEPEHVARALRAVADELDRDGFDHAVIRDENGNTVGGYYMPVWIEAGR